ncbi:metalloproteinase inhibitor 3-like [Ostrea edulis]|uniref:metalloproteinase inhibitor 3-like n=1 Tax=Ostrea edulis TaxID=37623 RepID=UPI0024AF4359|nr:metalloproteinase inhibitor 3-like [Ostrea edulis]
MKLFYLTMSIMLINALRIYGCRCPRKQSPQEKYCRSDFAILAKVTGRRDPLPSGSQHITYSVDVRRVYKGGPANRGSAEIHTHVSPFCSVNLNIGDVYLINGNYNGELKIDSCHMIRVLPLRDESADFPTLTSNCGPWLTQPYPKPLRF